MLFLLTSMLCLKSDMSVPCVDCNEGMQLVRDDALRSHNDCPDSISRKRAEVNRQPFSILPNDWNFSQHSRPAPLRFVAPATAFLIKGT